MSWKLGQRKLEETATGEVRRKKKTGRTAEKKKIKR